MAAVTLGTPEETAAFCGARAPGVLCLSDSQQHAFRAFGIDRADARAVVNAEVVRAGIAAALEGHLPGRTVGDPLQLPATFVLAAGGTVRLAYYSRTVADHPTQALLLQSLR